MEQHRLSILRRPLKADSKATETTSDRQYEQEQEKLRAKAVKASATQDRLMRSLYPMPEDKLAAAADVQQHLDNVMAAKLSEQLELSQKQSKYSTADSQGPAVVQVLAVAEDRPWLNPSLVYRNAVEEKHARQGHEQEVAATNRQLMLAQSLRRSMAEQKELDEARSALQSQSFWNMGSQPGDRHAPPGAHSPANARRPVMPAPWAHDEGHTHHNAPAPAHVTTAGSYGGGGGVPAAPMAAGATRYNAASNLSSAMDGILSQQSAAPNMSVAVPQQYVPTAVASPYATSDNNTAHIPARAPSQVIPTAPYLAAGASVHAPYATAGYAPNGSNAPAPTQQATGQRYASRPASSQGRSVAPWATNEELSSPASRPASATLSRAPSCTEYAPLYPTAPSGNRAQGPSGSMSQFLGSGALPAPTPAPYTGGGRPANCTDYAPLQASAPRAQGPPGSMSQFLGSGALPPPAPSPRSSVARTANCTEFAPLYPTAPHVGRNQGPAGSMSQLLGSGALTAIKGGSVRWEPKQQSKAFPWLN